MKELECPGTEKMDPRVRRTRKLLEDALRSLLSERPYAAISVGDIAERATVNRATFYAHFEDKEHLTTTMLRGSLEASLKARLAERKPLTVDGLSDIADAVYEFVVSLHQNCPKTGGDLAETVGGTLQETIQDFIRTWFELEPTGMRLFPGSDPETASTVLAWSIYGGAVRWSRYGRSAPSANSARQVVALLVAERINSKQGAQA